MKVHLKLAGVKLDKKVRELHKHPYIELYLSFFLSFFFLFFFVYSPSGSPSIHCHAPCAFLPFTSIHRALQDMIGYSDP